MSDDLISRRAAIDAVNSLTYPSSLVDVKRKLIDLPLHTRVNSVDVRGDQMKIHLMPVSEIDGYVHISTDEMNKIVESAYEEGYEDGMKYIPPVRESRLVRAVESMPPETQYEFLDWLMNQYGKQYTDSRQAVINWLEDK